jgi:hypothetical protein
MKNLLLVLALWLGAAQTVTFTNCCHGTLCSQKDSCPACPENKAPGSDDCCGQGMPARAGDSGCVHLEPSFEVDSGITPDHDFLACAWVELLATADLLGQPETTPLISAGFEEQSSPGSPPPLYLRHHALLI